MAAGISQFNLKSEADRLKTFERWSVPFMDPDELAAAGFYYTNTEDFVKCAFCEVEVGNWEEGDDPFSDHQRWQPSCPYIRQFSGGNIPLSGTIDSTPAREASRSRNACETPLEILGINRTRAPAYSMYATSVTRLKTFNSWPVSIKQRPDKLCEAGFFYTGKSDQTICFHCGGGLKKWKETDDPWFDHAKFFPKCSYVLLNKGREFVTIVSGEQKIRPSRAVKNLQVPVELLESLQIRDDVNPSTSVCESEPARSRCTGNTGNDDARFCKICYQENLGVLFLPCGHLVACMKCAPSLSTCAVCRQHIAATVRAFLS